MKKNKLLSLVLLAFLLSSFVSCNNSNTKSLEKKTIEIGQKSEIIGDLNRDGVSISIPEGALDSKTKFTLETSADISSPTKEEATLLGTPISIDLDTDVKRFDKPIEITFKLTDKQLESFENKKDIHIAYFDGEKWVYIEPTSLDLENKTVSYLTYHCSDFYPSIVEKEEMKKEIAKKMAVESQLVDKNAELRKTTELMVKSVMGPSVDKSFLRDIVEGILDQNDYTKLAKAVENGNEEEIKTQFIASYTTVTANTLLAYAQKYGDNLGDLGANLGLVGSFGSSAAKFANKDYEAAAKELALGIIDTHPVGKLFTTAVNVTNRQIARWKSEEIEAAYKIFINGKEPSIPFWGYGSIEAGDFDEIWNQMRGVSRQIIIDAVNDFKVENGREPDEDERKQIEADAKTVLETEFKERKEKETYIDEAEKKNLEFLNHLEKYNLLSSGRYGYEPSNMSYKERVSQLINLRNKILNDTKRKMNFGGEDSQTEINIFTVSSLMGDYLSGGEEAYNEKLIELGFIKAVDISSAAGSYVVPLVFSKASISETNDLGNGVTTVGNASISDTSANINLSADGILSISYEVNINSVQNDTVKYPSGFVENDVSRANYLIEESYTGINIGKKLVKPVEMLDTIGDRYYSGFMSLREGSPRASAGEISRFYVSGKLEKVVAEVVDGQLVITGYSSIELPDANVGNISDKFEGSFRVVMN